MVTMRIGTKICLVTGLLVAIALVPVQEACALDCVAYASETLELELESVTEDDAALADTSAYDGFSVSLQGSPYGGPEAFRLIAVSGGNKTWIEVYK